MFSMIPAAKRGIADIVFPFRILIPAITYTVRGILAKPARWGLLSLTLPAFAVLLNGYLARVFRGADPAPGTEERGSLVSDGVILTVLEIFAGIVIGFFTFCGITLGGLVIMSNPGIFIGTDPRPQFYLTLAALLLPSYIIGSFLAVIFIRTARSKNLGEISCIRAVLRDIGTIGWIRYFLSTGLIFVVIVIPLLWLELLFFFLGIIGRGMEPVHVFWISVLIRLIIIPPVAVFCARYMTLLYDSAAPAQVS